MISSFILELTDNLKILYGSDVGIIQSYRFEPEMDFVEDFVPLGCLNSNMKSSTMMFTYYFKK